MSDQISTRVDPYEINELEPNSFIFEIKGALPSDVCQEMVRRFEARTDQHYEGRIGQQASKDQSIKKTTDLAISGNADWKDIDGLLHRSLGLAIRGFRNRYPFFKVPFRDIGYNMQRYQTGEYYHWHIDGGSHDFADRQLVALWYILMMSTSPEAKPSSCIRISRSNQKRARWYCSHRSGPTSIAQSP